MRADTGTTISRRDALRAGLAVGAVAVLPAATAAAAIMPQGDDADLIALGKRFDEARAINDDHKRRIEAVESEADLPPRFDADPERWLNLVRDDYEGARAEMDVWLAKHAAASERAGIDVLEAKRMEFVDHVLDPIVVLICATPARTLAGLVVKARALQFVSDWWDVPANDLDLENEHARHLIDDMLSIAGRQA